jgi:hypothetical protein
VGSIGVEHTESEDRRNDAEKGRDLKMGYKSEDIYAWAPCTLIVP